MRTGTQSDYALRRTGNYFDLVEGRGFHTQPITFHEFLSKPESLFMYEESFMQIPGYIQISADIAPIEQFARQYVAQYIMNEFEHNLLGMQDYVRWSTLFRHKCDAVAPAFWSQVNMHDLMLAKDLEMDDNEITRMNSGNMQQVGGSTSTMTGSNITEGSGHQKTTQDIDNMQSSDSSTREANATVVRAEDQLTDDVQYNWSDAADSVHEIRSRAGDTRQHMESTVDSTSTSTTNTESTSMQVSNNSGQESTNTSSEQTHMTNKMFMQERQWAIDTARLLRPLEWLRTELRPMFYMLY